ncbi:hypothetical protein N665_0390s0015 [Sinapis alba]|nr:hypothetical protein N665_0390s0015 [Sinapis alba]
MGEKSKEVRGSSCSENAEEGRMKIASSVDALSELVWSPRNGLTLRCADFSFTGKPQLLSPNFFDHIGRQQTDNMNTDKRSMSTQQEQEDEEDERNQACNEIMNNTSLSGVGVSVEDMKPEREEEMDDDDDKVETNDDSETRAGSSKRSLGIGEPEALLANEHLRSQEEEETNLDAKRLEATDENNLASPASKSRGDCLPDESEKAGPSGSHERLAKAKGKEKALSDGNFDDEESFGSVESCNSGGLLLRGKKRPQGFEQQLILGSKRLKTLSQECLGSTSKHKQDSSFMNWISNMTKGIWKGSEEDNSPLVALTTTTSDANAQQELSPKANSGCRNTGFQSFFQSIYCQKKSGQDALEMDSLQELPWIPEQYRDHLSSSGNEAEPDISSGNKLEDKEPNISHSKSKPSEEQKTCNEAVEKVTNKNSGLQSKPKTSEEQKTNEKVTTPCLGNRNSGLESLWISRFSSKRSFPQKKDLYDGSLTKEVAKDANDSHILPIVSSLRIESSEAMASLFARRLEAMKHIMGPSGEKAGEGQTTVICFYCGKKGHRLQDCLQVTDIELRDLVQNISARNGKEEASSLCIRCFQLSHWAATCPDAPLYNSTGAEDRAMKHALASTSGTKLPFIDVPKTVFDAVQILRLTRTDVLKWINTKKSVWGLEGFFLRLRLGKWEEGLGGTGYHVARIEEGQSSRKHSVNSSIPVKVGGMTCYVESQFISNKDFVEEELKAWWRSTGKSAEKSGDDSFPSAEELSRKIQQRKMLGV